MADDELILEGVLREFAGLCAIPHPSGKEEKITDYLMGELRVLGYAPERDGKYNMRCDVPGTAGLEDRPRMILQAHTDMVCVGAEDYCPETDPIHTKIEDGWLMTDGRSSLGADCGIGLAAAMYIVKSGMPHCPLRLIFTADEERGLAGAEQLSKTWMQDCGGLVNLDGFHFGEVLISSAGGRRQTFTKQPFCFPAMLDCPVELCISGLIGGHSGDDIGKHRANAAQLLLWLLQSLQSPYELAEVRAGTSHNAIPAEGSAVIVTDTRDQAELDETIRQFVSGVRELYPGENITITKTACAMPQLVLTVDERDDFLSLGGIVPCGVYAQHPVCPEVTGSSGSLGMLKAESEGLEIRSFLRSCSADFLESNGQFLSMAGEGFGYACTERTYGPWPGAESDPLSDLYLKSAEHIGAAARKTAVHVGLETSRLYALAPEIPMISIGMDIRDPHSVSERVRLETVSPFVQILADVLTQWDN